MKTEQLYKIELPFSEGNMYFNLDVEMNVHLDKEQITAFSLDEIRDHPILSLFQNYAKVV